MCGMYFNIADADNSREEKMLVFSLICEPLILSSVHQIMRKIDSCDSAEKLTYL